MPRYAIRVQGSTGCGCSAHIDFDLEEPPIPGDVAAVLYSALDPDVSDLLEFLMHEHENGGHEKITVEASVKVR
jgi:hypothetical protein